MTTTYLVACGRKKAPGPAKARDFYTGRPTQRLIAEAEAQGRTFILSALHGLVGLDDVICQPYDLRLDDLDETEFSTWLGKVRRSMKARGVDLDGLVYVGSAPRYREAVELLAQAA